MSVIAKASETRQRLLDAARSLMLQRGFNATGIDQICTEAKVTKGAFFYYFPSKEALGQAALAEWAACGTSIYAQAKAEPMLAPLDHLHRFFEIMEGLVLHTPGQLTCLVGMFSQEMSAANPVLREACSQYLSDWAEWAELLLREAKAALPPTTDFDPAEVAWFLNCIWQGGMLIAKTRQQPALLVQSLRHARAYVDGLFYGPLP